MNSNCSSMGNIGSEDSTAGPVQKPLVHDFKKT